MQIIIRQIREDDASAGASLCVQLGYNLSIEQTLENIRAILAHKVHDAFVAANESRVIGWIGVSLAFQIESPSYCEIRGLVVDDLFRKQGVGKLLVDKAKSWSRDKGNDRLRLRCNMKRTETHLFYRHLGFEEVKEQKVFELNTR